MQPCNLVIVGWPFWQHRRLNEYRACDGHGSQLLEARGRSQSFRMSNIRTLVLDLLWYTPTEVEGLNSTMMEVHIKGVQLSACHHLSEHWGDAS
jgi:hypothetical protein